MWIAMNERFREEQQRFSLKASCEHCAYFCPNTTRCAMLYPVEPHREEAFSRAEEGERIYFCKMFEVDDA